MSCCIIHGISHLNLILPRPNLFSNHLISTPLIEYLPVLCLGLCGIYDWNRANDIRPRNGSVLEDLEETNATVDGRPQPIQFIKDWRSAALPSPGYPYNMEGQQLD